MDLEDVMKKTLLCVLTLAGVTLGGCVAVPAYQEPAGYYAPAPVVVAPSVGFTYYGGYGPRPYYYGHAHERYNHGP
jgi:hypothetical protein